jgi:lipid A 3-O-deacylase
MGRLMQNLGEPLRFIKAIFRLDFQTEGNTRIRVQIARMAARMALTLAIALSPLAATAQDAPIPALLGTHPWEYGVFVNGGLGTDNRSDYKFLWAGVHGGKVLTNPVGPGLLRGQFELDAEFMPFWQAYTPKYLRANCYMQGPILSCSPLFLTGGTYTGLSITPVILRWDLKSRGKFQPWVQGAGGLIWTNHKFPPVGPYPVPNHLGTSVFNFTPQFGVGVHYFVKPKQSISISANAVHISNASLGDSNPGVNASVQFSIGYTWWK